MSKGLDDYDWPNENEPVMCEHYDDSGDCDDLCCCGHRCGDHWGDDRECRHCDCDFFDDEPDVAIDV